MALRMKPITRDLMSAALSGGLGVIDKESEPYFPADVQAMLEDMPISEEMKTFILPLAKKTGGSPIGGILGLVLGMTMGVAMGAAAPVANKLSMMVDRSIQTARLNPQDVTNLWLRQFPNAEAREVWWEDLRDMGYSEDRILAHKELADYLPAPAEIMRWAAREVFEPELRERYQLDKFMPEQFPEWAAKVGITDEVMRNFWASHWELPSLSAIIDLWRRQEIDKDDVDSFWTELDMVPWIREKLFTLFRAVPTRVDVRRFWDMGTIDEDRLRQIYKAMGYWENDLEDYVLWTKVYVALPDLIARYKNGWIPIESVETELVALGMPETRVQEVLETKFKKPHAEERVADTTALTRSLIIKGAKKGELDRDETITLLMRKNYDLWEAQYIYDIEVEAAESPETPLEYRKLVEAYRKSQGMAYEEIPEDVLEADKVLLAAIRTLREAQDIGADRDTLDMLTVAKAEARQRYEELAVHYNL